MANVPKNIKKLRLAAKMTQDELAAKLHVTRQAVSNWENGKTQPDLEMLHSIANVFHTDEMELIYGNKAISQEPEPYPQNRFLRILITALFGGLAGLLLLVRIIWLPDSLIEYSYYRFMMGPVFFSVLLLRPMLAAFTCLFVLSLLSVWKDIRIKNPLSKKLFLTFGMACMLLYYGLFLLMYDGALYDGETLSLTQPLFAFSVRLFTNPEYIFSLIGIAAFSATNR